jgi:uncharacterized protein
MFRTSLEKSRGMVFIFPDSEKETFWMKNTIVPLDMIRLDANYRIVDIKQATPCTKDPCVIYTPVHDASYVVELNQ